MPLLLTGAATSMATPRAVATNSVVAFGADDNMFPSVSTAQSGVPENITSQHEQMNRAKMQRARQALVQLDRRLTNEPIGPVRDAGEHDGATREPRP